MLPLLPGKRTFTPLPLTLSAAAAEGEAADRGDEAVDVGLVAGEEHVHALVPVITTAGPHHLALLAVHELVAVGKGMVRPRVEHLVANLVAARQRLRIALSCSSWRHGRRLGRVV